MTGVIRSVCRCPAMPGAARVTRMSITSAKVEIATASLNSDSPSARIESRLGAPTSRKMPITAAGSVVDTMAPSSRQTTRSTPVTWWTTTATTPMQTSTATMASNSTAKISSSRRRTSIVRPALNSSGGRNIGRKSSVRRSSRIRPSKTSWVMPPASAIAQTPAKPRPRPAIARSTVCGSRRRSASGTSRLTSVSTMAIARSA